eukprot:3835582-Prymnesium_polylepis.1
MPPRAPYEYSYAGVEAGLGGAGRLPHRDAAAAVLVAALARAPHRGQVAKAVRCRGGDFDGAQGAAH